MTVNKQYLVSEDALLQLLAAAEELQFLEGNGVDNWTGYSEGRGKYIADRMTNLTHKLHSEDDIYNGSLDMMNIAEERIKKFSSMYS